MLQIITTGSFDHAERFLSKMSTADIFLTLGSFAQQGVDALAAETPSDTGETAASWYYEIENKGGDFTIWWKNRHLDETGTPIAVMLQLGHGTGTGGYVQGRDYITPAIQPIFDRIANEVWKEVTSS